MGNALKGHNLSAGGNALRLAKTHENTTPALGGAKCRLAKKQDTTIYGIKTVPRIRQLTLNHFATDDFTT